jgi:hypothetical protein
MLTLASSGIAAWRLRETAPLRGMARHDGTAPHGSPTTRHL